MDKIKICFVGVGSIAKRHIRNLHQIGHSRNIDICIDAYRRSGSPIYGVETVYTDFHAVPNYYDAIFITNPTEFHLESLVRFHDKGMHFFIEKPVVSLDQIDQAKGLELKEGSVYYVACPLRYHAVIEQIKNHVNVADVISVRCISSSYLPDWRAGQDYRKTYSSHKDMGGGVSIDLIHEWDYLTYLFGSPKKVKCLIGKKSNLEIDSDDYAVYIAEYPSMIAELHLDYFGRKTIREIQLITKYETIIGDIANYKMINLSSGQVVNFNEERDDYQKRELNHFLDMITHSTELEEGYHHGLKVLNLTQGRLME